VNNENFRNFAQGHQSQALHDIAKEVSRRSFLTQQHYDTLATIIHQSLVWQ
jgi:hypothetical protein